MRTLIAVGCLLVALMAVAVSAANPEEHTDEEQMPEVHSQGMQPSLHKISALQ